MIIKKRLIYNFIIITLCVLNYIAYIYNYKYDSIAQLNNNLLSYDSISFYTNNEYPILNENINKYSYRIFCEINGQYQFFYHNNSQWEPPMISGRFFNDENDLDKAVIGRSMEKYIKVIDNVKYIEFKNNFYPIIGVLGTGFETTSDNMVLIYKSDIFNTDTSYKYNLDSDKKVDIENVIQCIRNAKEDTKIVFSPHNAKNNSINYFNLIVNFTIDLLLFISFFALLAIKYSLEHHRIKCKIIIGIQESRAILEFFLSNIIELILACFSFGIVMLFIADNNLLLLTSIVNTVNVAMICTLIFHCFLLLRRKDVDY